MIHEVFHNGPTEIARVYVRHTNELLSGIVSYRTAVDNCTSLEQLEDLYHFFGSFLTSKLGQEAKILSILAQINSQTALLNARQVRGFLSVNPEYIPLLAKVRTLLENGVPASEAFSALHAQIGLSLQYYTAAAPFNRVVTVLAQEAGFLTYQLHTATTTTSGYYATVSVLALLFIYVVLFLLAQLPASCKPALVRLFSTPVGGAFTRQTVRRDIAQEQPCFQDPLKSCASLQAPPGS